MSWLRRNRHWILLALVAVTTVLAVGTVGVGLLGVLAGLAGGAGVGTVLGDAALVLLIAALLVAADIALAMAFLVTVARQASLPDIGVPENERVAAGFARIERALPPLAKLGLADRFALSTETKREQLKQRYVDGDLTQVAYERQLRAVLDEEDDDRPITDVEELDADLAAGNRVPPGEEAGDEVFEEADVTDRDREREPT